MNFLPSLFPLLVAVALSGCAATSSPYGAPRDTSDPWQLIHHARGWLQQGRPRGALPSLQKALVEVEKLDHGTAGYSHAKAAIHNELGRVYEMVSDLDTAEAQFLQADAVGKSVPERRPLHFESATTCRRCTSARRSLPKAARSYGAQ